MHLRYPYAAVDGGAQPDGDPSRDFPRSFVDRPSITFWAAKPLQVGTGRVIAVRLRAADQIMVRWVDRQTQQARWLPAISVLTEREAQAWVRTTRFYR